MEDIFERSDDFFLTNDINEKTHIIIMQDFAAIDFETANYCRSSVCSVGVVIERGGETHTENAYVEVRKKHFKDEELIKSWRM